MIKSKSAKPEGEECQKQRIINMSLNQEKKSDRSTGISKHLLIITLNINRFNSLLKRHRLSDLINKQDPKTCHLQEAHCTTKDTD
jgi:hypothetical protein